MIYTINTRNDISYELGERLSPIFSEDMYNIINEEFALLKNVLLKKGIKYDDLKHALIPQYKSHKKEILFCFDSMSVNSSWYGNEIMCQILHNIETLNRKRKHAILYGDFTVPSRSEKTIFNILHDNIMLFREFPSNNPIRYFLVYINNITEEECTHFVQKLKELDYFIGYGDMTYENNLKDILGVTPLIQYCIQINDKLIFAHEDDRSNMENVDLVGYACEEYGFSYVSIQQHLYSTFLEYKIDTRFVDRQDLLYCINAISRTRELFYDFNIVIPPEKFEYILNCKNSNLIKKFEIDKLSLEEFIELLRQKIKHGYIFNLKVCSFEGGNKTLKFNNIINVQNKDNEKGGFEASFEYLPDTKAIRLITFI